MNTAKPCARATMPALAAAKRRVAARMAVGRILNWIGVLGDVSKGTLGGEVGLTNLRGLV